MILEIELSKLILLDKNPRKIGKEQFQKLIESMKVDPDFLNKRPILVNHSDGKHVVYAGNQRVRAAKKLKWKTIPAIIDENLDEAVMNKRIIQDNKQFGEFDFDILANSFDFDMLLECGFDPEELLGSFADAQGEAESDRDDNECLEPAKDEDAITKLGDLYELGEHRLICGDSTDHCVVTRVMGENKPIIMVTDPPYGVNYDPSWREKAGKGVGAVGKVKNDDKSSWSKAYKLFTGSIAYIWCASLFSFVVAEDLTSNDFELKSLIIWQKQHFSLSRGDYHWKHEPCWYAVRKGSNHNWKGDRKQTTVWEIANLSAFGKSQEEDERTCHSTQKPLECMARPIRHHTDEGDYVYDPFLGSGTTLIAAEKLKRKCIGIELSCAYVDICISRWIRFMQKNNNSILLKKNGEEINPEVYLHAKQ